MRSTNKRRIGSTKSLSAVNVRFIGNAVYAAKERVERKNIHGWFPDNILPESTPPQRLTEFRNLAEIPEKQARIVLNHLPSYTRPIFL